MSLKNECDLFEMQSGDNSVVERRTHDRKVSVSSACSSGGIKKKSPGSKHIKGSEERYLLGQKQSLQIFGVIPFVKLQNDT